MTIKPPRLYYLLAILFIIFGLLLKFLQVWFSSSTVDADSAVVGLMGLHILEGKDFPLFFYGQPYMGSFQALIASFYFRFLGVSPSSLYLVSTTFWALFVAANFFLVKKVFGLKTSLLASLFLAFPPAYLDERLFRTWGGYMEMLFFGTLLLLLTLKIIERINEQKDAGRLFGLWGFLAGLSLWIHFAVIFYLLTALLIYILAAKRRVPALREAALLFFFFVVGLLPVLVYNLFPAEASRLLHFPLSSTEPWQTWHYLFPQGQPLKVRLAWGIDNLLTVFKVSLPMILGVQGAPGYYLLPLFSKTLLLFYAAVALWIIVVWDKTFRQVLSFQLPNQAFRLQLYPFFLFLIAVLGYCFGNFAFSFGDPRYLFSLYSVFPTLAAGFLLWVEKKNITIFVILFLFLMVNHLYPAYGTHLDVPVFTAKDSPETVLIDKLKKLGARNVYAGYLVGFPLTFMTREKIIASPKYGPHNLDRYPVYTRILEAEPNPFYVFFNRNAPNDCCEASLSAVLRDKRIDFKRETTPDFNIYYDLSRDARPYLDPAK